MTPGRLLRHSLLFHWRGNLAVLLGVAVGTAVLTGALLVGDSLRGSLRDLVHTQLGWVDHALVSQRFVSAELARELTADRIAPAILARGAAIRTDAAGQTLRRAGRVTILGVDGRFWTEAAAPNGDDFWNSDAEEVALNQALAELLGLETGDFVTLHLPRVSDIPRESLLGHRDSSEVIDAIRLRVRAIIPDSGPGRFNLAPSFAVPLNAFVPLRAVQTALFPKTSTRAREKPAGRTSYLVNTLLVGGGSPDLQEQLRQKLTLDDWGLRVTVPRRPDGAPRGYLSLESRQLFLAPAVVAAATKAAHDLQFPVAPTLVYLANSISHGANDIPYSVVAALDPTLPPPLGPFLPAGVERLNKDDVVLVDWDQSPLTATPGDPITLAYYKPEDGGKLSTVTATLQVRGLVPLADHSDLTPDFPGLTDRLTIKDWNPPFKIDQRRIQDRDEHYWEKYRATPKAYVTLEKGQDLWGSRFGQVTSIRVAPRLATDDLAQVQEQFGNALLAHLRPEQAGFTFEDVKQRGLDAARGSADFGAYFLMFSIFLIAAALLLVGLLFRLNLERRAPEVGVLLATGYRERRVRNLLLGEGAIVAAIGALLGILGAALYAWLLLELLRAWWPGAIDRSLLRLHLGWGSIAIGYVTSLVIATATMLWAVRTLSHVSPRALLAGETSDMPASSSSLSQKWSLGIAALAFVVALALLVLAGFTDDPAAEAATFFGGGAVLLIASLMAVWAWLRRPRQLRLGSPGPSALAHLGMRNAARSPMRSLLVAGLLAFAVFLVVGASSFQRVAGDTARGPHSGTGGFALIGESSLPIYQDLNSEAGRAELNLPDQADALLADARFYGFRLKAGDDASCLNLLQPTRPQILGVPAAFAALNRFRFETPRTSDNPWTLLDSHAGPEIPAFVDATTAKYILHRQVGDTLEVINERGENVPLQIVGLLDGSIFQSQLLISEADFLRLYPNHDGYQFYLIDASPEQAAGIGAALEKHLADQGFTVTKAERRLEAYWAVENTYLATFQALGGLGLLLGALGLAVVLLRTVWERRGELALLRALGYRRSALNWLLLSENGFLLILGLAVGTIAAMLAVFPHLQRTGDWFPLTRVAGLLLGVLAVGLLAGAAATAATLRTPLIPALRRE
jgi:ABC-type lipoprotein release transport system permease subunit